jgi:calcium-dependent protein kinase
MGICQSNPAVVSTIEKSPSGSFKYQTGTCALEYWEPILELGEGSISSIHLVKRRKERVDIPYKERADIMALAKDNKNVNVDDDAGEIYVLKSIIKEYVRNEQYLKEMRDEINIMSKLDHPHIAKVYEAYERRRHIYLIMEYCRGGDLSERDFGEEQAAKIIYQVLSAVDYMHKHQVVHRDLKLENIMLNSKKSDACTKIIDFGLATRYLSDDYKRMTGTVGTLYSMAPQVLQGVYDFKCDLWSVGVVAYMLLSSDNPPFYGPPREMSWEKRRKIMIDRIMRCQYTRMTGPKWDKISPEAKSFVRSLFQMDPKNRPNAEQALKSPWMLRYKDSTVSLVSRQKPGRKEISDLKHTARVLIAGKLSEEDIVDLEIAIKSMDPENLQQVKLSDFVSALAETQLTGDDIATITKSIDREQADTTFINYVELVEKVLEVKRRAESEHVGTTFSSLVVDAERRVPKTKLVESLRDKLSRQTLLVLEGEVEEDSQGLVTLEDVQMLLGQKHDKLLAKIIHEDTVFEEELLEAKDAVIPGGRNDPDDKPHYAYDEGTNSVRWMG